MRVMEMVYIQMALRRLLSYESFPDLVVVLLY